MLLNEGKKFTKESIVSISIISSIIGLSLDRKAEFG